MTSGYFFSRKDFQGVAYNRVNAQRTDVKAYDDRLCKMQINTLTATCIAS